MVSELCGLVNLGEVAFAQQVSDLVVALQVEQDSVLLEKLEPFLDVFAFTLVIRFEGRYEVIRFIQTLDLDSLVPIINY